MAATEICRQGDRKRFVTGVATHDIGLAVVAGRTHAPDDKSTGSRITNCCRSARRPDGEPLALVHARSLADAEAAAAAVISAYSIGASKPAADKSVIRRILLRG